MQAIAIADAGMTAAASRLNASAERTARSDVAAAPGADLVRETVEQVSARTDFRANAAVIKTASAMTGALLDMKV
jgi:flagellar basal body rod protein FlgC